MITTTLHPEYVSNSNKWYKWRLTYQSGDSFIVRYLKKFSLRESEIDFRERRNITYCPAFAKAALNEIKNSIFQRAIDISRKGGSINYQSAIAGRDGGVDLSGSSMNSFIGRKILPELLSMQRVGIYVDMPVLTGPTIADKGRSHPYLYIYKTEAIKSWSFDPRNPDEPISVLLEDSDFIIDDITGLTTGIDTRFRHLLRVPEGVLVTFYDNESSIITQKLINIPRIPFVILQLSESLLEDAANYQIALLNLESGALDYCIKSNYPFYTEQYDARTDSPYLKKSEDSEEIKVGVTTGRRYPKDTERPAFIHPSSEPLKASMEKSDQIKKDIRLLINLAVTNLQPKSSSADSKKVDNQSLEAGLSYIGLELENTENIIGRLWSMYEGTTDSPTIQYPANYSLKSEDERNAEAANYESAMPKVPSKTYQKELAKRIAEIRIGAKVSAQTLKKIQDEIDAAEVVISDPTTVIADFESGFVGLDLASKIRGYPANQVEQAKKDHADRIARIAMSQSVGAGAEARGTPDLGANPQSSKNEKTVSRQTTTDPVPTDKTRGAGA